MKKILILPLMLFIFTQSKAQISWAAIDKFNFQDFLKSKTYVFLTGDSLFDAELVKTMTKHWKITPFEIVAKPQSSNTRSNGREKEYPPIYIGTGVSGRTMPLIVADTKDIETIGRNPKNSILVLLRVNTIDNRINSYGYSPGSSSQIGLKLLMGCPTFPNAFNLAVGGAIGDCDFGTDSADLVYNQYYLLQDKINTMHNCLSIIQTEKLKKTPNFFEEYFNKDIGALKTKTLYVLKAQLKSDVDIAGITKVYPYKVKIASDAELKKAEQEENKNVVYMSFDTYYSPIFFDIATHKCIGGLNYGSYGYFRTKDFKEIMSLIKKYSK